MAEAVQDAQDTFSGTKEVDERHRIDEARLADWMAANVEGYQGPMELRQFKGGQSNPTYQVVTAERAYVLRRKPPGKLLPSAHAVDREFKVIAALNKTGFPVAKAYALCTDESVIGQLGQRVQAGRHCGRQLSLQRFRGACPCEAAGRE